jgi:hypothetical protein
MKVAFCRRGMDKMGGCMGADSMVVVHIGKLGSELTGDSYADTMVYQSPLVQLK